MQIIVAGHLCLDIIPNWQLGGIESLKPGRILEMEGITFSTGGAVSNTGTALKRLGFNPLLCGRIGDDHIGNIVQRIFGEEGLHTDNIVIAPGETTSYTIVLNPPRTDRVFLHFRGTNHSFTGGEINFYNAKGLFHFGYPPLMESMYGDNGRNLQVMFTKAKEAGLVTSLDLAMPDPNSTAGSIDWQSILAKVLPHIDLFLPSIDELLYMLDRDVYNKVQAGTIQLNTSLLDDLSEALLAMGGTVIAIKIGDQGLYLRTGSEAGDVFGHTWANRHLLSPCFQVRVAGTTGAGDTTIAGFLAGIAMGKKPEEVVTLATAVGAYCVEELTATGGIPSLSVAEKRIKQGWARESIKIPHPGWELDQTGVLCGSYDHRA